MADSPIPRRPRFQFRLRTLFVVVTAGVAGAATIYAVDLRLFKMSQTRGPAAKTIERAEGARPASVQALDGKAVDPLIDDRAKAVVFLFTRTECPIANRYAPEFQRLYAKFAPQGILFQLVYPEASDSAATVREHLAAFRYPFEALRDPEHVLVQRFGVKVTPEVVVFVPRSKLTVYRGRVDNLYADFGRARPEPTTHELEDALEAVLSGRPVSVSRTTAVGCTINELP